MKRVIYVLIFMLSICASVQKKEISLNDVEGYVISAYRQCCPDGGSFCEAGQFIYINGVVYRFNVNSYENTECYDRTLCKDAEVVDEKEFEVQFDEYINYDYTHNLRLCPFDKWVRGTPEIRRDLGTFYEYDNAFLTIYRYKGKVLAYENIKQVTPETLVEDDGYEYPVSVCDEVDDIAINPTLYNSNTFMINYRSEKVSPLRLDDDLSAVFPQLKHTGVSAIFRAISE